MPRIFPRILSLILSLSLIFEQPIFAQVARSIDLSSHFANFGKSITQADKFRPLHLRYISYDSQSNDFKLLLDKGDTSNQLMSSGANELNKATQELLNYFFIGLSLPNDKFWVNLRPDSPDNIIDDDLAKTDIGRIFLEADVQLKKDTSSLTSPQTKEGKEYWDKLYKKAEELFGSENITIPTLTRPWIVPNEIIIRESPEGAYIYKATLKVMLEEDYLKSSQLSAFSYQQYAFNDPRLKELNEYSTKLIRETIIPKLTYEVNISKRYAPLRQVYYSLILAQWFKQKFKGRQTIYSQIIDSNNLIPTHNLSLITSHSYSKQTYFQQYQKSFKDGEYNIQEPIYTLYGQSIRRYMSGGIKMSVSSAIETVPSKQSFSKEKYLIGFTFKRDGLLHLERIPPIEGGYQTTTSSSGIDENKYRELTDEEKKYFRNEFDRIYGNQDEPIGSKGLLDSINQHELSIDSGVGKLVELAQRLQVEFFDNKKVDKAYVLGRSLRHLLLMLKFLNRDDQYRYGNLPFSGEWYEIDEKGQLAFQEEKAPTQEEIRDYEKHLKAIGFDLDKIVKQSRKVAIIEFVDKGGGLKSFLSVLSQLAKLRGISDEDLKNNIIIYALQGKNSKEIQQKEFAPFTIIPFADREYRELISSIANTHLYKDNIGAPYPHEEWHNEPQYAIEGNAVLMQFRIIDYLYKKGFLRESVSSADEKSSASPVVTNDRNEEALVSISPLNGNEPDVSKKQSSPLGENNDEDRGGIDLRALPITTQAVVSKNPAVSDVFPISLSIDFNEECRQMETLLAHDFIPATARIRDMAYAASGVASLSSKRIDAVISYIAQIFRKQEERLTPCEPALKQILIALESDKPATELQLALSQIAI